MFGRHAFIVSLGIIAAGAAAAAAGPGGAGSYPDHPIRVIVSVPAGGGVDTVTRLVTAKMQTILGQPMVVENRAGVGGSIAAEYVFGSPPDGYTLLASQPSPITTNPLLYKSLNYDPAQLAPVAIMSHIPNVVLVRENFPAKTVAGIDRLRQGQSRQDQLCVAGHRHDVASDRRAVPEDHAAPSSFTCPTKAPRRRSTTCSPAMSI